MPAELANKHKRYFVPNDVMTQLCVTLMQASDSVYAAALAYGEHETTADHPNSALERALQMASTQIAGVGNILKIVLEEQ